jgi:pimeloyl-ACP methyl ester carboxylesterase
MRRLEANGVELCVDEFGGPDGRPMLLIAGSGMSLEGWPAALCERLAAGGRRVVRYDHRDTGQSVAYPPGEPGYTGMDLSDDAVGVLDALGIERADLVGISMGAGIAQDIAIRDPERVRSLTLIATSFADRPLPDVPLPDGVEPFSFSMPEPDWSDRDAAVEYLSAFELALAGPARAGAEEEIREAVAAAVDRSTSIASIGNHDAMEHGDGPPGRLEDTDVPALVVSGTHDPFFPPGHGEALAAAIPGARLIVLDGVGHEVPPPATWDRVVPAILALGD